MFNPSREEVRQFFCETWRKYQHHDILTPLETIAADWMAEHPEYSDALADANEAAAKDYTPDQGQSNPFLHLSMHLAISEQIAIDQPRGIRAAHERLSARLGSEHESHHQIIECLGETMWEAQRSGTEMDSNAYIERIQQRATRG